MTRRHAFTLIELLVVMAIISLLIAMLLPALGRARQNARRAVCLARLDNIGTAMINYAVSNQDVFIKARHRSVQIALNAQRGGTGDNAVDWVDAAESVGLTAFTEAWECPDRPGSCQWEPGGLSQMIIGYQYFGGIDRWLNPFVPGGVPSRSPINLTSSQPDWVMAADTTMKIDNAWGGGRSTAFGNMPTHRGANPWPEGGNHLYVDGSATWIRFEEMIYIHTWNPNGSRIAYFHQQDLGEFDPPAEAMAAP